MPNVFYFSPDFWKLPEGEKAAVIAHEYFHHKQNTIWMVGDTIGETLSGKVPEYGSRTEDKAHLFQMMANKALGLPPDPIVVGYFAQRNLYRFMLTLNTHP